MFALQAKKDPIKKHTAKIPARKNLPGFRQAHGSPIQMKNVTDLTPDDFTTYNFDTTTYSSSAYYLWLQKGAVPNLPDSESQKIYYEAIRMEQIRQLTKALSSTDPATHPETARFQSLMQKENSQLSAGEIDYIWNLLLTGKQEQENLNAQARLKTDTPELKAIYGTTQDYLFTSDLDEIRNNNPSYKKLAELVKPMLGTQGKKLALWSGGYDLSDYACKRGYVTLEGSTFGKILDSLYLSNAWNLIGPLWNIISKTFVEQYIDDHGTEIHVFIRAYDPASVLIRQEISEIYNLDPHMQISVKWHCIAQQGNDYYEICEDGTLAQTPDEDHSAYDESNCLMRLTRFFSNPQNQQSYGKAFHTMTNGFQSVLASDFSQINEHLAVSEFRAQVQKEARQLWLIKGAPNQTQYAAEQDYITAERNVIEHMRRTWCQNKANEIWQKNGSIPNQSEQEMKANYNQAELDFQNLVNDRIQKIMQERKQTQGGRILQKARFLWVQKGKPQQSREQQDQDYYDAMHIIVEEDNRYDQKIPYYAQLEILMNL